MDQENNENMTISIYAHEGMLARMERTNHRLWIVVILLIVCFVASNLAWILYEAQWEVYETTQEVSQTAESTSGNVRNTFVGGNYGESDADSKD